MLSVTKINRDFSFPTKDIMGYLILKTLLLKVAIPNGSNLEGVLFIWHQSRGSQQAHIKEDEDSLSGRNLIKNK